MTPIIAMREATTDQVPRTAAGMAAVARAHGYTVRITYARGTAVTDGPEIDSVVVRMYRGNLRAAGCWENGKWRTGLLKIVGMRGVLTLKSRQMRTFLAAS